MPVGLQGRRLYLQPAPRRGRNCPSSFICWNMPTIGNSLGRRGPYGFLHRSCHHAGFVRPDGGIPRDAAGGTEIELSREYHPGHAKRCLGCPVSAEAGKALDRGAGGDIDDAGGGRSSSLQDPAHQHDRRHGIHRIGLQHALGMKLVDLAEERHIGCIVDESEPGQGWITRSRAPKSASTRLRSSATSPRSTEKWV